MFSFLLHFFIEISVSNSADPDQMPHLAASEMGLHCLYNTPKDWYLA